MLASDCDEPATWPSLRRPRDLGRAGGVVDEVGGLEERQRQRLGRGWHRRLVQGVPHGPGSLCPSRSLCRLLGREEREHD
jgi:hypothetical protein